MKDMSTREILTQLENDLKKTDADGNCPGNRYVNWKYEAYIEHRKFWVDSWLTPQDPGNSIWFIQTKITPLKAGARISGSAAQAGIPATVQPGLNMSMHSVDETDLTGEQVRISVTGYVKVNDRPHNQFCFEVTVTAG